MKRIVFLSGATEDFNDAVDFYDSQALGLGRRFSKSVQAAVEHLRRNPSTGILTDKGTRTLRISKFPYGVVFREYASHILIVAVNHSSRRENYWADRIENEE